MERQTLDHPVIGEIVFRRSRKALRLSIVVRNTGVVVVLPRGVSVADAMSFVDIKAEWVLSAIERNRSRVKVPEVILPPFSTRLHALQIVGHEAGKFEICIKRGVVIISHPVSIDPSSSSVQRIIRKGINEAYKIEARMLLPQRVETLAEEHGLHYSGLSFRNTVSRWGSCSADDHISLSTNLMLLSDRLIDYVILHELCHTVHKNHGPGFHALLDKVTGGKHLGYRKELRGYTTRW